MLTVRRHIDFVRQFRDVHIETILNLIQRFSIGFVANESNRQTFGTKSTSSSYL